MLQTVLTIGTARLILTFSYIKTKNIWVSFIVHLLNDWVLFGLAFLASTR
ncbi:type II CAAX prenyl endopeptidase Rce1 family protein [Carnobacterium maltaromaticum]